MGIWDSGLHHTYQIKMSGLLVQWSYLRIRSWAGSYLSFLAKKHIHGNKFMIANIVKYKQACVEG